MKETVIVFRTGSLGDTVVALPAFHHIRRQEPDARIVLLTNIPTDGGVKAASSYQVLAGSGLVDDYAEYRPPRSAADILWLTKFFRNTPARRLYYLMPRRSTAQRVRDRLFFSVAGTAPVRGLAVSGLYDKPRLRTRGSLWESESLRLLRMAGGEPRELTGRDFDLKLTACEKSRAAEALTALGGTPYLIVSLGTKLSVNDWGDENWHATLLALSSRLRTAGLVTIGSGDEFARCQRLSRAWGGPAINLCGLLTPRESGAVAAGALLFLGHDSGPAHLAAAAGATVVAVYSGRNPPGVWFPFGNEERVLWTETNCAGCGLHVCVKEAKRCILGVTPDSVVAKVASVLADAAASALPAGARASA